MIGFSTVMIGLPGQGMRFGIDPLSLFFIAVLLPQMLAGALAGRARSWRFWLLAAGLAAVVLGRDAFTLIFGFGLAGLASRNNTARLAQAALVPAVVLPPGNLAFGLILLAVAGAALQLSDGLAEAAFYILVRYGFIVLGPSVSPLWGGVLAVGGVALALRGAGRAMFETGLPKLLDGMATFWLGLAITGLGLALAIVISGAAVLALQAALLAMLALAWLRPLLALGAGAVAQATGTSSLDWLGGLLRGMPRLGLLMLAGALGMAMLPPGPGFPALFLMIHAVILAASQASRPAALGIVVVLAGLALAIGLMLAAATRLIGMGWLGRPRSLRAAAAEEAPRPVLLAMGLLALCLAPLALLPGLMLDLLRPVVALLAPGAPAAPVFAYAPLTLVALMFVPAAMAYFTLRRFGRGPAREAPDWHGGFGKPPAWLPFGDPAAQPGATGFAAPARAVLRLPTAWPRPVLPVRRLARWLASSRRSAAAQALPLALAALVLALLLYGPPR